MARRWVVIAPLFAGLMGVLLLFPLWSARTGEYHVGEALVCYDCHTMHFSMQHGWGGGPVAIGGQFQNGGDWLGSMGPNPNLLKLPENQLCLGCHDGQNFAPDVLGPHANNYVRQAGALNQVGGAAPYENWKGHTLDMKAVPPGGVSDITITCGQCHAFHGSPSYRNLKGAIPVTYTKGEPYATRTKTVEVWLKQWVLGDLAGNYAYDSVRFNERNPNNGAYADFCQGCHVAFHGAVGDNKIGGDLVAGGFLRHPNAQVNIGAMGGGHSSITRYNAATKRVHVMSNATADYLANPGAGGFVVGDGLTPSCFSCHKAHGNKNPFGLIFLARDSAMVTEEGTPGVAPDVGIRNLCGQCHVQGN
jgi:hypothetical protein